MHGDVIVKLSRLVVVESCNALAYSGLPLAHLAKVAERAEALLARGRRRVNVDTTEQNKKKTLKPTFIERNLC